MRGEAHRSQPVVTELALDGPRLPFVEGAALLLAAAEEGGKEKKAGCLASHVNPYAASV